MWALLSGYKTFGLVAISFLAQGVGYLKPEYAPVCDKISVGALSLTPVSIRMAITSIKGS